MRKKKREREQRAKNQSERLDRKRRKMSGRMERKSRNKEEMSGQGGKTE